MYFLIYIHSVFTQQTFLSTCPYVLGTILDTSDKLINTAQKKEKVHHCVTYILIIIHFVNIFYLKSELSHFDITA